MLVKNAEKKEKETFGVKVGYIMSSGQLGLSYLGSHARHKTLPEHPE